MNKELFIALINKDLQELEVLTKGFSEMENFPKTLIDLAVAKAQNIADCLQKLPLNEKKAVEMPKVEEKVEKTPVVEEIEQEIVIEITEEQIEEEKPEEIEEDLSKIEVEIEYKIEQRVESYAAQPDLKQFFSIADRFRFQRELFGSNGENFSQSLADFNSMQTIEQAQNHIETKLKFDLENPVVQDFMQILKRKLN